MNNRLFIFNLRQIRKLQKQAAKGEGRFSADLLARIEKEIDRELDKRAEEVGL